MLICCIWIQFRARPCLQVAYKFMVINVYNLSTWFFDIIFSIWNSEQKSPSIKKIEKIVWETLSRARNVDEKLVQGDQIETRENEDEEFHTPTGNPMKDNTIVIP